MSETLRKRVERTYRYTMTGSPTARELVFSDVIDQQRAAVAALTFEERVEIAWQMGISLRVALFDLAEQVDLLLGGQIKPE